jgi:hypothetical protein
MEPCENVGMDVLDFSAGNQAIRLNGRENWLLDLSIEPQVTHL